MGVFYMRKTDKNGKVATKVATEEAEVEFDKKHGWKDFDPDEFANNVAAEAREKEMLTLPKKAEAQAVKTL